LGSGYLTANTIKVRKEMEQIGHEKTQRAQKSEEILSHRWRRFDRWEMDRDGNLRFEIGSVPWENFIRREGTQELRKRGYFPVILFLGSSLLALDWRRVVKWFHVAC
jgi:hypothetical protein